MEFYLFFILSFAIFMAIELDAHRRERVRFIESMADMQKLWNNHAKPMFADCNSVGAGMTVNRKVVLDFNGKKYNATVILELVE